MEYLLIGVLLNAFCCFFTLSLAHMLSLVWRKCVHGPTNGKCVAKLRLSLSLCVCVCVCVCACVCTRAEHKKQHKYFLTKEGVSVSEHHFIIFFGRPRRQKKEKKGGLAGRDMAKEVPKGPRQIDEQTNRQTDRQTDRRINRQTKDPTIDGEDMSCACVFLSCSVLINKTNPFYPFPAVRYKKNHPFISLLNVLSVFVSLRCMVSWSSQPPSSPSCPSFLLASIVSSSHYFNLEAALPRA
jgi:hypothetical protein